jgi:purine-binding chemotaxis protein CheW
LGEGVARVDFFLVLIPASARHRRVSTPPVGGSEQRIPAADLLLFSLDGRSCAIAASAVVEILAAVATSPLPRQPGYIAGVIDLRGTVMPVLDLRARFGYPSRPMELTDQMIVVRARRRLLALWIDEVTAFAAGEDVAWTAAGGLIAGDRSLAGVASDAAGLATIHDLDAFVEQCELDAVFEATGA